VGTGVAGAGEAVSVVEAEALGVADGDVVVAAVDPQPATIIDRPRTSGAKRDFI
jgi:hypothetical protein